MFRHSKGDHGVPKPLAGDFAHLLCLYSSACQITFMSSCLHYAQYMQYWNSKKYIQFQLPKNSTHGVPKHVRGDLVYLLCIQYIPVQVRFVNEFTFTVPPAELCSDRPFHSGDRQTAAHERRQLLIYTDMLSLTTGIRSEKCVFRRFRRCENVYLHKPR
jgi:hypothetical protein